MRRQQGGGGSHTRCSRQKKLKKPAKLQMTMNKKKVNKKKLKKKTAKKTTAGKSNRRSRRQK
jgi:hypothetical protein